MITSSTTTKSSSANVNLHHVAVTTAVEIISIFSFVLGEHRLTELEYLG